MKKPKRSHKNTRRLTATERVDTWVRVYCPSMTEAARVALVVEFQAHEQEVLRRNDRRVRE